MVVRTSGGGYEIGVCYSVHGGVRKLNKIKGVSKKRNVKGYNKSGGAGNRTPCLSHAKRALYHMSYTPVVIIGFYLLVLIKLHI